MDCRFCKIEMVVYKESEESIAIALGDHSLSVQFKETIRRCPRCALSHSDFRDRYTEARAAALDEFWRKIVSDLAAKRTADQPTGPLTVDLEWMQLLAREMLAEALGQPPFSKNVLEYFTIWLLGPDAAPRLGYWC